jgi:hypothetical protein
VLHNSAAIPLLVIRFPHRWTLSRPEKLIAIRLCADKKNSTTILAIS